MTASRPDLLPFALPSRIGLDKHGLVVNGKLAGDDYPITAHCGQARAVAGQTTATGTDGFQSYALLSGRPPNIGGQELTSSGYTREEWIYSDSKYSWVIRADLTHNYTLHQLTLTVTLQKSFGVLGRTVAVTPRTLASITWQPTNYAGTPVVLKSGSTFSYHGFLLTHSMTGGVAVLNVARKNSTTAIWGGTYAYSLCDTSVGSLAFHDSLKVTVTGDGDLDDNGAGITASITNILAASEMLSVNTSTGSVSASPDLTTTTVDDIYISTTEGKCTPPPDETCRYIYEELAHPEFLDGSQSVDETYDDRATTTTYLIGKAVTPGGSIVDLSITRAATSDFSVVAELTGTLYISMTAIYNGVGQEPIELIYEGQLVFTGTRTKVSDSNTTLRFSGGEIADQKQLMSVGNGRLESVWVEFNQYPFVYWEGTGENWPNLETDLVSNIQDGTDFAPASIFVKDEVVFHSANVFGLWKRRPIPTADTYVLLSVDGQTKELGSGLSSGQTVTYHPVTRSWAIDTAAVWV